MIGRIDVVFTVSASAIVVTCVCDARTGDAEKIINSIQSELGHIAK